MGAGTVVVGRCHDVMNDDLPSGKMIDDDLP